MQETGPASVSAAKALQANMTLFIQLIGLGVALWGPLIVIMIWMSGNFADIRADLVDMEKRLTAQIQELDDRLSARIQELDDRLSARIQELDDRLSARIQELDDRIDSVDNKLVAIGDMTVIAFTDGEITGDELAAIWERASDA